MVLKSVKPSKTYHNAVVSPLAIRYSWQQKSGVKLYSTRGQQNLQEVQIFGTQWRCIEQRQVTGGNTG